jgi:hypothetical protein
MARISDLHKKWLKEPKHKKAYDAVEEEFVLASAVMNVRNRAGLTQEETGPENGYDAARGCPAGKWTFAAVDADAGALADATGSRLLISFEPRGAKRRAG